jgi:hypothetical protein
MRIRYPQHAADYLQETNCEWSHDAPLLRFSDVSKIQALFRSASSKSVSEWRRLVNQYPLEWVDGLLCTPPVYLKWSKNVPILESTLRPIEGWNLLTLMGQVLQFEKLQRIDRKICARSDCFIVFRVEGRRDKKYCSPNCANVARRRELRNQSNGAMRGIA